MVSRSLLVLALLLSTSPVLAQEQRAALPAAAPMGTGRLYLGGYVGTSLLVAERERLPLIPAFGVLAAGPLGHASPSLGFEWLATLDARFGRTRSRNEYPLSDGTTAVTGINETSVSLLALPGARLLVPVRRRFLIHADVWLGALMQRSWGHHFSPEASGSLSYFGVRPAFRLAAGAVIPYNERLRFTFTPFALQNHANVAPQYAVSVQLGLEYALN